jgi:predicted class III extradiol MEMO1 family dioxygenase
MRKRASSGRWCHTPDCSTADTSPRRSTPSPSCLKRLIILCPNHTGLGHFAAINREGTLCGFIPTATMLIAARALGATRARLMKHATSGDINHDYGHVVGYASIIIN